MTGFAQDDSGVSLAVAGAAPIRAQYLVGCDGGRSMIRKTAGIAFPGSDPTMSVLLAEVVVDANAPWGLQRDAKGVPRRPRRVRERRRHGRGAHRRADGLVRRTESA